MVNPATDDLSGDNVVISGIAGIFPSCDNIEELKESLFKKENLVKSVSQDVNWQRDKLEVTDKVGRINNPDKFDNIFFGISAVQTEYMDPLTRKILERSFEAIIDSGHNPSELRKYHTNIYMGSNLSDSESTYLYVGATESGFSILGHNRSMLANRVSYWLNTHGTSFSFLSTEPAGLQGITMAYNDIKAGHCDAAIVGTVFLLMHPEPLFHYKGLGVLTESGTCKSFDAEADGYPRAESCVVIFMQRADTAKRIYSTVLHSDFTCFGDQQRLISPHENLFTDFLLNFYKTCGVDPSDVAYLEADGCGTKFHDPEELNAVDKAMLANRDSPLLIGSVKTNLGHTDAASTFTSLAKVIIAMETGLIPPTLFYKTPSPFIPALKEGRFQVVTDTAKWNGGLVAINGLGIGCHYAHTLLRSYNKSKNKVLHDNIPKLMCVSGRNENAVKETIDKIVSMPFDPEFMRLIHEVHATNIANHNQRGYVTFFPSEEEKISTELQYYSGAKQPVWFVFSGMGSQWIGMGRDLMRLPILASTLQKCHDILLPKGIDLMNIITGDDPHTFDNILHSFVGIAAIQLALVDLLKTLKIEPDGIIGHSVGELGCAYADGCFTLEQMILAAYYRGMASIETELIHGSMAAIGMGYEQIKDKLPEGIDVACHNSGDSCTLSGPTDIILSYVEELKNRGVFAKAVNVSNIAYHSRYIKSAAPKLLKYLKSVIPEPKPRSSRWVSSSVPEAMWDEHDAKFSSPEYHTNNLLNSVLFEEASKYIPNNAITIEIAPHGLLQAILRRSLGSDCVNISLTQRGNSDGLHYLFNAIGKLYLAGLIPQVSELYPPVQFPVSRGTPSLAPLVKWEHDKSWHIASLIKMVENPLGDYRFEVDLRHSDDQILRGQKINGHIIYPPSAYLNALWFILITAFRKDHLKHGVIFENVKFHNILKLSENSSITFHVSVMAGSGKFEIYYQKRILVTGIITMTDEDIFSKNVEVSVENGLELSGKEIYKELEYKGHQYNNFFRKIIRAKVGKEGAVAKVQWFGDWLTFIDSVLQLGTWQTAESSFTCELPTLLQKVIIDPKKQKEYSSEITAVYNRMTNTLRCGGIEISGIETSEVHLSNSSTMKLETIKYLSHEHPCLQSKDDFLDASIQILLENLNEHSSNKVLTVIELNNDTPLAKPLLNEVKCIISHRNEIKADLKTVSVDNMKILSEERNISLVLGSEGLVEQSVELLKNSSGFLLLRLPVEQTVPLNLGLVTVLEQRFDNENYILVKKSLPVNYQKHTIHLETSSFQSWIEKLKHTSFENNANHRTYVVCEEKSQEKVTNFIAEISQMSTPSNIRYIFIMDKNSSWDSCLQPNVYHHLSQDLLVNVYYNGSWGSFRQLSLHPKKQSPLKNLITSISVPNVSVRVVALNNNDWCINDTKEININDIKSLGAVEVSGWDSSGKRTMGLAQIDRKRNVIEYEPSLSWTVPDLWSLQDAATAPLAFSMAYYTLTIKTSIKEPGVKILVHGGHTLFGEAFIAVALQFKCTVYTTVSNDDARQYVRKRFPQISNRNIFQINKLFNFKLMDEVNDEGVDIIINCLNGSYLESTLKCFKLLTDIFHFCRTDVERNTEVGMELFLECCNLSTVLQDHLFMLNAQEKKQLHDAVEEGIKSGVVQPLPRRVHTLDSKETDFVSLNYLEKLIFCLDNKQEKIPRPINKKYDSYQFPRKSSCLVIGNKPEDCLDVARWLVTQQVSNVIMYSETPNTSDYVKHQLKILHSSYSPHARFALVDKSHAPHILAASLIKECMDTALLDSIFIVSLSDKVLLHHLDISSRNANSLNNFVCLSMDISKAVVDSRREAGLSALNVKWSPQHTLQQVLPSLEYLLPDPPLSTVYVSFREEGDKEQATMSDSEKTEILLPSSQKELEDLGRDVIRQKTKPFIELDSLSPGLNYVKEVLPFFIIPGVREASQKICGPLARNFMYPVVLLRIPNCDTIHEMAMVLKKHIRTLQKEGPYNIVGLSLGGALALEVAQQLQDEGQTCQAFLVNGIPETLQVIVKTLGEDTQLQVNLITKLLDITSEKVCHDLLNLPDWDSRLERSLSLLSFDTPQQKTNIKEAVTSIYKRLAALVNYTPKNLSLSREVYVIQTEGIEDEYNKDIDEVPSYKIKVHSSKNDHYTLLNDRNVADIICDNALVNRHLKESIRYSF